SFAAAMLAAVTPTYGADGAGSTVLSGYTLTIDQAVTDLTSDGKAISLSMDGNDVVGSTEDGAVFRISVDETGEVTLTQYAELDHLPESLDTSNDNANIPLPDDLVSLSATATVTDGDNDQVTTTVSLDLGGNLSFDDDLPSVSVSATTEANVLLTTQDAETIGTDTDIAVSTANFSGVFGIASSSFGADGAGDTAWSYDLSVASPGVDSTLVSNGDPIYLYELANGTVVGSTSAVAPVAIDSSVVFSLEVSATGEVRLSQYQEIDHEDNNDTSAPYDDQFAVLGSNLVSLTATVTVTDGDNDQYSDSETIDLGGNVRFADDGPQFLSVMDAVISSAATISFNGLYDASFGADGLDFLSAALAAGGTYGDTTVLFVQVPTDDPSVTRVDVTNDDGSGDVMFSFYFTSTTSAVSDGGNGSVLFSAFGSEDLTSEFFTLTVNPDGTYTFDMISNTVISTTTVSGEDFGAFGPTDDVATADLSLRISGGTGVLTSDQVNASNNGIGVGTPTIESGEWMNLHFTKEQNYVRFSLQQFAGAGTALLLVTLDGVAFDFNPDDLDPDTPLTIAKPADGDAWITVIVDPDMVGQSYFDAATDTYFLYTDSTFTDLRIDHDDGSLKFNVNDITYDQEVTVEDLALNFELSVTDQDGDTNVLDNYLTVTMLDPDDVVSADIDGVDGDSGVVLVGNGADDTLIGGLGDDLLIGGHGDDLLTGGDGDDTFIWNSGDHGSDVVQDFDNPVGVGGGQDVLDLSQLLAGIDGLPDLGGLADNEAIASTLDSYLSFTTGPDSVITVDTGDFTQSIELAGVDLAPFGGSDYEIIVSMLDDGALKVV
ncbi:DUF5801 repeats-in-toxin domain-containing protein, partial [Pseudomonas sp. N040]|uniref:DUF5801 repeats-in-toxin domain-containing protein n=1 Tax=Pseudomonas sp. N040 TaxID=2785325 RepID=UPI001A0754B6